MLLNSAQLGTNRLLTIVAASLFAIVVAGGAAHAADDLVVPAANYDEPSTQPDQGGPNPDYKNGAYEPQTTAPKEKIDSVDQQDYMSQGDSTLEANPTDDSDPLMPFNEKMFTFNLKLDQWILRPVASGYAAVMPKPVRQSVGRFFENAGVIPRFANNLFQLRFAEASGEVARFGINSTLGLVGFFDPAENWFGLKEHRDDFGLTLRYYGAPAGPYVMLPGLGPSTVTDTIGMAVDHAMNPMSYLLPWPWYIEIPVGFAKRGLEAINYRSLRMDQFEAADRYAVDLYGAVQDAYLQTRAHELEKLSQSGSATSVSYGAGSAWALIAAPSTIDFPNGNWSTPRGQWLQVSAYGGEKDCEAELQRRGEMGEEHPLECIPTNSHEYSQIVSNSGR